MTNPKRSVCNSPAASTREAVTVHRILITRPLAEKVLATMDLGLGFGLSGSQPGDLCVEADAASSAGRAAHASQEDR